MKSSIERMCIPTNGTLRSVLESLQESAAGIAIIVDGQEILQGVVTDGDVRRALLEGGKLDDPVLPFAKKNVVSATPENSRAEVLDLMQAMRIDQLPVLDPDGRVCGVHLLHETLGAVERPNWAVIMAGGRGVRLGEFTKHTPKPMLKVAGRPILERLVLHFISFGVRKIFLSVNYLSELIEGHFGDGSRFGCEIHYLHEEEPLGTGGPLSLLPEAPSHPVYVSNGDLVTQANLDEMMSFHQNGGFEMTMGIYEHTHQIPYGCVYHESGRVSAIVEKPTILRSINAGIYVLNPTMISRIPKKFFPITELIGGALNDGIPLGAWHVSDEWIDVGHKDELLRARNG